MQCHSSYDQLSERGKLEVRCSHIQTCRGWSIVPRGYAALVGQVSGDAALVPLLGPANEGGVEDQPILGCVALGLQGSEEGLLCT